MELLNTPSPKKGTWAYKFVAWFCNNVNFCHGYLYDTDIENRTIRFTTLSIGCGCSRSNRTIASAAILFEGSYTGPSSVT